MSRRVSMYCLLDGTVLYHLLLYDELKGVPGSNPAHLFLMQIKVCDALRRWIEYILEKFKDIFHYLKYY